MFELESGLIFWTSISFGLLVLLLYRFALPPVIAMLEKREKMIADAIAQAEENRQKAENLVNDYQEQLREAQQHSSRLIEAAHQEALSLKAEIIEAAEKRAAYVGEQAKLELAHEKERLLQQVKQETIDLVISASSKLLRRVITVSDNRQIIEESLKVS